MPSLSYIAGNVKALKSVWFVGDHFLSKIADDLADMPAEARRRKCDELYLFANYKVKHWCMNVLSSVKPSIVRILNSLTEALNECEHLPKYIFVIPDIDIVESLEYSDFQVRNLIDDNIHWLVKNISKLLLHRLDVSEEHIHWSSCFGDYSCNLDQDVKKAIYR